MKILLYTPVLRQYGPAIVTHLEAIAYSRYNHAIDHWLDYQPDDMSTGVGERCLVKYSRARRLAIDGDYDVLITCEDDMLIPRDGIERLLRVLENGADVSYGLYIFRHGFSQRWSAFYELSLMGGQSWGDTHYQALARPAWEQKQVVDVIGMGLGFTAIKPEVLQTIPFTLKGDAAPDWYFAIDAKDQGFVQRCDLGCACGHFTVKPSPRIYWPDLNRDGGFRTDFLP